MISTQMRMMINFVIEVECDWGGKYRGLKRNADILFLQLVGTGDFSCHSFSSTYIYFFSLVSSFSEFFRINNWAKKEIELKQWTS